MSASAASAINTATGSTGGSGGGAGGGGGYSAIEDLETSLQKLSNLKVALREQQATLAGSVATKVTRRGLVTGNNSSVSVSVVEMQNRVIEKLREENGILRRELCQHQNYIDLIVARHGEQIEERDRLNRDMKSRLDRDEAVIQDLRNQLIEAQLMLEKTRMVMFAAAAEDDKYFLERERENKAMATEIKGLRTLLGLDVEIESLTDTSVITTPTVAHLSANHPYPPFSNPLQRPMSLRRPLKTQIEQPIPVSEPVSVIPVVALQDDPLSETLSDRDGGSSIADDDEEQRRLISAWDDNDG